MITIVYVYLFTQVKYLNTNVSYISKLCWFSFVNNMYYICVCTFKMINNYISITIPKNK